MSTAQHDLLRRELGSATSAKAACEVVTTWLCREAELLASVYLRQGDRLRCFAVQGYWQIFDGIPAGAGVIGRTFASGRRTLIRGVSSHADYLEAAPAVQDELCIPLVVHGTVVGALNAESQASIDDDTQQLIDDAAAALVARLHALPLPVESAAQKLGRHAAALSDLAERAPAAELHDAVARAAVDISGLTSAMLCLYDGAALRLTAATGELAEVFRELSEDDLHAVGAFVDSGTSAYTVGDAGGVEFAAHQPLRQAGAASLLVLPLRAGRHRLGLLLVADREVVTLRTEDAELLELIASEVVSCLQLGDSVRELRLRAERDALTGLGHHAAFHAWLPTARASRENSRLAVLYVDVDHFKDVNDSQGHAAGDELLMTISRTMSAALRATDRLFRIGGDEFAALVEVTGEKHALSLADRLLQQVLAVSGATLSIGVAVAEGDESDAALLARADAALYDAKAAGRCAVRLHRASRST